MTRFAYGRIIRLDVVAGGCTVLLDETPNPQPKGNRYHLRTSYAAYETTYAALLLAASMRIRITLGIQGGIDPNQDAIVDYARFDF